MKTTLRKIALLFLMSILFFNLLNGIALGDINISEINFNPNEVNQVAEITFNFTLDEGLSYGNSISIKFPAEFSIPNTIEKSSVSISRYNAVSNPLVVNVIRPQNIIVLFSPFDIVKNEPVSVMFHKTAKIVNPQFQSTYTISLWTQEEPNVINFPVNIGSSSGSSTKGIFVVTSPSEGGQNAEYNIIFKVNSNLFSSLDDYVDLYFPNGTTFPGKIESYLVLFNRNNCEKVEINNQRVRVYLPSAVQFIGANSECSLYFLKEFGIKNPLLPGYYSIQISTSKDTGVGVSSPFYISGSQVRNATLLVEPLNQLYSASYTVRFRTSELKSLIADSDLIFLSFPKESTLSENIKPEAIKVNDIPCKRAYFESNVLVIEVPIDIPANSSVEVSISKDFGIKNPSIPGTYSLEIYTSSDSSPVELEFEVTSSIVSTPNVVLSSTTAGQLSSYCITFNIGASGSLTAGLDRINIVFPVGTTLPSSIPSSSVTVNNIPSTYTEFVGTTLKLAVPISITAGESVVVFVSEDANIRNPIEGGSYKVIVSTSKEQSPVESNPYNIVAAPETKIIISPAQPDGKNGFYKTLPSVNFTSYSSLDANPVIYYFFDNGSPLLYEGGKISVPEGVHILYYYAIDNQGNKEIPKTFNFKVDSVPPEIVLISPKDQSFVNSTKVTVIGTTEKGASVKVNGIDAEVDPLGNFAAEVSISGDEYLIRIESTDLAGNYREQSIKIFVDTKPPFLEVVTPLPFQEIHNLPIIVRGKTETGAVVKVNGKEVEVDPQGNFIAYLNDVTSSEMFFIEIIASDKAGNSSKKIVNIKYFKTTIIKLMVGSEVALINGKTFELKVTPVIKNGMTFVPLRFVSEAFGTEVEWDGIFKIVSITLGDNTIKLQIGKKFAMFNGKQVNIDAEPFIINGSTMVPIRVVSELFGSEVFWDGNTKTVTIIYPKGGI